MIKRFVVTLNSSTKEQNGAFIAFVKENGLGWWHWLDNFWLLTDRSGKFTAITIRDKADEFYPGVHKLVLQLDETGDTWAGFGPNTEKRNMFTWLIDTWDKYK